MDAQNTTNTTPPKRPKQTKTPTHIYTPKQTNRKSLHTYPLVPMYTLENGHMDTYTPPRTGGEEAEWRS